MDSSWRSESDVLPLLFRWGASLFAAGMTVSVLVDPHEFGVAGAVFILGVWALALWGASKTRITSAVSLDASGSMTLETARGSRCFTRQQVDGLWLYQGVLSIRIRDRSGRGMLPTQYVLRLTDPARASFIRACRPLGLVVRNWASAPLETSEDGLSTLQ